MKRTGLFFCFSFLCVFIIILICSSGCANIIPPTGGPRDSVPPRLINVVPIDSALHFNTNKIVFNFDEYLEVKDVQQNLIVSPVPKGSPTVDYKLRTITVKLKDTLEPNATYALDFGKAIRDINEGNILKNFRYVFSTGSYIDSMQLRGKVVLAISGKADSTLIVMLHRKLDDSAVAKERPRYITRLDSAGNFTFKNLAPGTYAVYALKDESGSYKYTSKTQLFGFIDSPVVVQPFSAAVTLYAYADTADAKPVKKTAVAPVKAKAKEKDKDTRLVLQANITGGKVDLLTNLVITFQNPLKTFDSTKIHFTDDKYVPIPAYRFVEDTSAKKITLLYKFTAGAGYSIIAEKDFAEDTLGKKLLKTDTIPFHAKDESEYGSLRLRFVNLDLAKNPVLQFIQSEVIKLAVPITRKEYFNKLFIPGEYELRILYDDNKNGVWDPGKFFGDHKQPEKVYPIKQKFKIKNNWDNEFNITL